MFFAFNHITLNTTNYFVVRFIFLQLGGEDKNKLTTNGNNRQINTDITPANRNGQKWRMEETGNHS